MIEERFSSALSEIEREIGAGELNKLVLSALKNAVQYYKGDSMKTLYHQMEEVVHILNNTQPRYAILIYNIYAIFDKIRDIALDKKKRGTSVRAFRKAIIKVIDELLEEEKKNKQQLIKNAVGLNMDGKTILIHDHSSTVQEVLCKLKKKHQKFNVIVAEQDMEKTLSNIEVLSANNIPFHVVPAHMLSNIEDEIDACFFGALTLKSTYDFVVDTGTNAIISEFHLQKKPIYLFLTTSKFSLWQSKKKEKISRRVHTRKHPLKDIEFERLKFSHDRVPLSAVDYTVTEEGVLKEKDLKNLYRKKFRNRADIIKKFNCI